jgi:hypothetical protein
MMSLNDASTESLSREGIDSLERDRKETREPGTPSIPPLDCPFASWNSPNSPSNCGLPKLPVRLPSSALMTSSRSSLLKSAT